jgi:lambda family phage portal protein
MEKLSERLEPRNLPATQQPTAQETAPQIKTTPRKVKASGYSDAGASRTKNAFKGYKGQSLSPKLDIDFNNRELRSRSRMLCMSSPLATSAINTLRTNVVEAGIIPKPRIDTDIIKMTPEEAFELQKQIEREWTLWAENKNNCDATGLNDFYGIQQLAFKSFRESGDSFCLFQWAEETKNNPYSLRLHILEADRICTPTEYPQTYQSGVYSITEGKNPDNNNPIYDGVEVDRATGKVVAYWVCNKHPFDYTEWNARTWQRIEAVGVETEQPNILHIMESGRPDQYRGVPMLAPTIERVLQINRYGESVVSTAVMHAKQTMVIETNADPTVSPFDKEGEERIQTRATDIEIGAGAVNVLQPGEKMTAFNPAQPTSTYESFIKTAGMEVGAGIEIPRGQLMKDFNSSYSATRGELLEFHKFVKMNQRWFITDFCRPVYERWFIEAVARGRIKAPSFFTDPLIKQAYMNCEWIVPSFGQIDPVKEVTALKQAVENGWTTNEAAARQYNGSDFYHNATQLKREREAMEGINGNRRK